MEVWGRRIELAVSASLPFKALSKSLITVNNTWEMLTEDKHWKTKWFARCSSSSPGNQRKSYNRSSSLWGKQWLLHTTKQFKGVLTSPWPIGHQSVQQEINSMFYFTPLLHIASHWCGFFSLLAVCIHAFICLVLYWVAFFFQPGQILLSLILEKIPSGKYEW